jgi:Helix-turn-helix domain
MTSQPSSHIDEHRPITVHLKVKSVLRLLQGESSELVADELAISPERLLRWKERFIEGGRAGLLRRRADETAKSEERRKKRVQWIAVLIGLTLVIWVVTRIFAGIVQGGG